MPNAKRWPWWLAGRDDSAGEGSSGMWSRCAATRHDFIQRCMGMGMALWWISKLSDERGGGFRSLPAPKAASLLASPQRAID